MTQFNLAAKGVYTALFLLYVGLAYLFSSFSPQAQVVSLWPSAGVALAGVLVFKARFLPAVFLGSLIFNLGTLLWQFGHITPSMLYASTLIALGVVIQTWVNARLLAYFKIDILKAPSHRHVALFIGIAFFCSLISALVGNTALMIPITEAATNAFDWDSVFVWWVGGFLGVILVAPLLLSFLRKEDDQSQELLLRGLAIPLFLIVLAFQVAQQYVEEVIARNSLTDFTLKAKVAENSLNIQMGRYLESLEQLDLALSRQSTIGKAEFETLAHSLMQDLPGIRALSWNPIVEPYEVADFEAYARTHIDPGFQVKGAPLQPNDPLVVVKLIEPLAENRAAQGFNVYSNPVRKESMLHAKNGQVPTATDVIQLVQSNAPEPGFLIFSPVFRGEDLGESSLNTTQTLDGFAVGVFLVSEIIKESFQDELIQFIDIYIYENNDASDKVFGNEAIMESKWAEQGISYTFDMFFAEHQWTFNLHVDENVALGFQIKDSLSFLLAEMVFGMLAVFVVLSIFGRQEKLRYLVNQRTKELKALNVELEHYAFYDSLTGLPNRRLFTDRLDQALKRAARNETQVAVLFMDLNRFKQVNDGLGHESGDQLLQEVARRFNQVLRDSDTLARIGGDEFTLLMEASPSNEEIITVGQKLLSRLNQPIDISGKMIMTSASIGVAIFPRDGADIADLMRGADTAMYHAKHSAQDICFYSERLLSQVSQQLFLDNELPHALAKHQLELYFQPILNLQTQKHIGAECLLRWNHPTNGVISPAHFIPAAETSGEIIPIGYWVIDQACVTVAKWQRLHPMLEKISVNVSTLQLQQDDFYQNVKAIIESHGIRPEKLQFEVTETALMRNASQAIKALRELKSLGITIAIDDYGTGYSALRYLKILPVDVLKIDRSFVQSMCSQSQDYAIVKSTVYLASELGIQVIAEGIETQAQVDKLRSVNCEMGQGFLFSKPLPENEYLKTLDLI